MISPICVSWWNTSWSPTLHQRLAGVPSSGSIICSRILSSESGGSLTLRTDASSVKMMGRCLSAGIGIPASGRRHHSAMPAVRPPTLAWLTRLCSPRRDFCHSR